jgi:hypothetical protein
MPKGVGYKKTNKPKTGTKTMKKPNKKCKKKKK